MSIACQPCIRKKIPRNITIVMIKKYFWPSIKKRSCCPHVEYYIQYSSHQEEQKILQPHVVMILPPTSIHFFPARDKKNIDVLLLPWFWKLQNYNKYSSGHLECDTESSATPNQIEMSAFNRRFFELPEFAHLCGMWRSRQSSKSFYWSHDALPGSTSYIRKEFKSSKVCWADRSSRKES